MVDESHATIPQIGGMYEGDRSRKTTLVDYGFRLPSALDNRPLKFAEFMERTRAAGLRQRHAGPLRDREQRGRQHRLHSAPARTHRRRGTTSRPPSSRLRRANSRVEGRLRRRRKPAKPLIVEQIIRPTGLLDPVITLRPLKGQIDETIELCRQRIEKGERVLVTTLTKRTAEDLTDYLRNVDLKVRYLHSDIDAIERVEILRGLRAGEFDILVGINLLREGLDLPEVSLVCILDADKEGFLRSETTLIQTAGRAARHVNGEVVLFADQVTDSIQALLDITRYRRRGR